MIAAIERPKARPTCSQRLLAWLSPGHLQPRQFHPDQAAPRRELSGGDRPEEGGMMGPVIALTMAGAASAHQAATATHRDTSQEKAGRRRRSSANRQGTHQGATAAAAAAPAALDSLSRLQQLADASPQVALLRRLQALADGHYTPVAQLAGAPEEEELIQGQFASAELQPQLQQAPRANNTGLPDQLKSGIESLSGLSMDDVRVHYNSGKPAQLQALAYTQGTDIHVAPGQEQHLAHEAWHVVQQKQGRVRPTLQMKEGVPVNDDAALEKEADVMGPRAASGNPPVALEGLGKNATMTPKGLVKKAEQPQVVLTAVLQAKNIGVVQRCTKQYQNKETGRKYNLNLGKNGLKYFATISEITVGKQFGKANFEISLERQTMELHTINVTPEEGSGLGVVLMYHMADEAVKNDCTKIEILNAAVPVVGYYMKMGARIANLGVEVNIFHELMEEDKYASQSDQSLQDISKERASRKHEKNNYEKEEYVDFYQLPAEDQKKLIESEREKINAMKETSKEQLIIKRLYDKAVSMSQLEADPKEMLKITSKFMVGWIGCDDIN